MKLVGIGDLFIPCEYIENGIKSDEHVDVTTIEWKLNGFDELQNINLIVEQGGREDYDVPQYIIDAIQDADIVITQFCPINKKVIDACRNLKYIGVMRAGYENVNVDYAKEKGITVFNTPGRNAHAVSDFTVGMIICEARNIARGHMGIKTGNWIREYSNSGDIPDLEEKTVGIIGYGEIGRLVARKLSGFNMNIIVYDPFCKDDTVEAVSLDELMSRSDFITLHARLTEENKRMIGEKELSLMKKDAYIINTSRSGLIDEAALYEALKSNSIAGAAIDVFDEEPPAIDYPLVTLDNVTLTPHMAGGSNDAFKNTPKKLMADIKKALNGDIKSCRFIVK